MGQGQDKVALSLLDLQPTAIVELFLLYFNSVDKENVFIAFHGGSVFSENIKWQGVEYLPIPVESEGFERFSDKGITPLQDCRQTKDADFHFKVSIKDSFIITGYNIKMLLSVAFEQF